MSISICVWSKQFREREQHMTECTPRTRNHLSRTCFPLRQHTLPSPLHPLSPLSSPSQRNMDEKYGEFKLIAIYMKCAATHRPAY